jgi:PAS domain S-box-containing protein
VKYSLLTSIRAHLIFLVLISVLPAIGIIIYAGLDRQSRDIKAAENNALKVLHSLAYDHERIVESIRQFLMTLVNVPDIHNLNVSASNKLLGELLKQNPLYGNIFVVDAGGMLSSSAVPAAPVSMKHRKYFQDVLRTKDFSAGEYTVGAIMHRPVIYFAYPVSDTGGRFRGVIAVALDLEHYGRIFTGTGLPEGSVFGICDHKHIRLYRSLETKRYAGEIIAPDMIGNMMAGPAEGVFTAFGVDRVKRLIAYRKFYLKGGTSPYLFMRVGIPEWIALADAKKTLFVNVTLLCLAFIIALVSAWFVGNIMIAKRLNRLVDASRKLGHGDLTVRTGLDHSEDELGQLAHAFDEMADALERNEASRKQTEEVLKQSEEKYRNIFENAVEGIFQTTPEGRFISVNPAFARMIGYDSPEEMIQDIADIGQQGYVNPEDRIRYKDIIEKQGIVERFEIRYYRKDGGKIWVSIYGRAVRDATGRVLHYEGTIEDITERKLAEASLRDSESRYRELYDASRDGIVTADAAGKITTFNKSFKVMLGYTDEEIRSFTYQDITPERWHTIETRIMKEQVSTRGYSDIYEKEYRKKDGAVFPVELRTYLINDTGNKTTGYWSIVRDITERRRTEEDRILLEAKFRQSQKMEAIGTLTGGIAHDFNNILTALIGYGSLLQMKMDRDDPLRVYVDQILTSSEKAANLTQSLLAFSRKQIMEFKPHSVKNIISEMGKLLKRLLTEDIELKVILADEDVTIMADITQMDQVLMNLATNARDVMHRGGILTIETKEVELDRAFTTSHGYGQEGTYVLISVSDTGCGMDKETKEKIFDPFFTTKDVGKGTGLGLSIVYGIIKQHNGYIEVQSEPDHGTTFYIYLPAVKTKTEEVNPASPAVRRGTETILLAEDNTMVRDLAKEVLAASGYSVIEAANGEDAIHAFAGQKDAIALMILDVVMPKKNGKEVYEEVRKTCPDIKVLFMSGYTGDVVLDKGVHGDAANFIAKPLLPDELLMKVREVLDR